MVTQKLEFEGGNGARLAARLDLPVGPVRGFAIFAHCFTCSKDLNATRRISSGLSSKGIAVLRFDFTGLGSSEGEFSSTNFSSNVADLVRAANMLREEYEAPGLLIGHSLGGAAVLVAASAIPELKAVVTIGAPADASHVVQNFSAHVENIEKDGKAEVSLGGRKFTIEKQFLEDLAGTSVTDHVSKLKLPLLIFHSPLDATVGIENAATLFKAAKHPKSFVSLDQADHLLASPDDAAFVASTIAAWSERYMEKTKSDSQTDMHSSITVSETGIGKFQNAVSAGAHFLLADEPRSFGGTDSGPSPYDFLSIGLGACTNMTLRMYADRKGWDIGKLAVTVDHHKVHAKDCETCSEDERATVGKIDRFHRIISLKKDLPAEMQTKLLEIADKCPVHKTLHSKSAIITSLEE